METKISVMRQFGTEQFSMTISYDKVPSQEELEQGVASLGVGISAAFIKVNDREESERHYLVGVEQKRTASLKAQNDALDARMEEAKRGKILVRDAENLNRRSDKK